MSTERFKLSAAVYLILVKNGKVLLLRRFNTGWMNGHYTLVSGHLDGNEPVFDCMIREAKEEAGISILKKDLEPVTTIHRYSTDREYIDFFFVVKKWKGEIKIMEPNKCDDLSWFPVNDLPNNTLPFVANIVKNYKNLPAFYEVDWK